MHKEKEMENLKTCKKCGQEFPATEEYFYRNEKAKDGLQYSCKECLRKISKNSYVKKAKNVHSSSSEDVSVFTTQKIFDKNFDIYGDPENPLFLAKDVANWIDYDISSLNKMINTVDSEEKVRKIDPTLGGNQEMWLLTEDGLYEVLMQSRKPKAKTAKKEIKQILKNIRQFGGHLTPQKIEEALLNPDVLINLANQIKEANAIRAELEKKIEKDKPKVEFADSLIKTDKLITFNEFSKSICDDSFEIGSGRLFKWAKAKKIINAKRVPYQQYITNGSMQMRKYVYETCEGYQTDITPLITPKGQLYFYKKLNCQNKNKKQY